MKQIFLNEFKSKRSSNVDSNISVDLSTERKLLPTDDISETVDSYEEYAKEKDASGIFRLMFTINPVCSNILFNGRTEIVQDEGSPYAKVLDEEVPISELNDNARAYANAYGKSRINFIDDTTVSHPLLGNYTYHCGIDIFNNHMLRKSSFIAINNEATPRGKFNTLSDYLRDSSGEIVKEKIIKAGDDYGNSLITVETDRHLYTKDSLYSFSRAINDRLVESDGWVGFINPVSLNLQNVSVGNVDTTVNKCINNCGAGDFIDMYPGRDLYSFVPNVNPYRKRIEKNWDYCLTYPYESVDNFELVSGSAGNGLKCEVVSNLSGTVIMGGNREDGLVYLRTQLSNTFQKGDTIKLSSDATGKHNMDYPVTVENVGHLGEDTKHYFAIKLSDLYDLLAPVAGSSLNLDNLDIRVRRYENGLDCKYYLRKFRKVPNFNSENICVEDGVSEEEIEGASTEFGSTMNKLAFSENIFSDRIAQILYDEDIILTGLRDNLGRPVSEIYLTIIKRNAGREIWKTNPGSEEVEYSHCFGEVTSGFDLLPDPDYGDYNVHKIWKNSEEKPLESDITENNTFFYGDIVEFSPSLLRETVIEEVYHRFNTAQRDDVGSDYPSITYTEIISDDFDIGVPFRVNTGNTLSGMGVTLQCCSEGYYYKPHYRIPIKEYDTKVLQGSHRKMVFSPSLSGTASSFTGRTAINYYLCSGDTLYLYKKEDGGRVEAVVTSVGGTNFSDISFKIKDGSSLNIEKYGIFKVNTEMPDYSYDLMDATGRYLWREPLSDSALTVDNELYDSIFTNGAHYRHLNINFYLRRQDPTGEYGLNEDSTLDYKTGAAGGQIKDVSVAEYEEEKVGDIC